MDELQAATALAAVTAAVAETLARKGDYTAAVDYAVTELADGCV